MEGTAFCSVSQGAGRKYTAAGPCGDPGKRCGTGGTRRRLPLLLRFFSAAGTGGAGQPLLHWRAKRRMPSCAA